MGLSLTVLFPARTGTVTVFVAQVSQAPVVSNEAEATLEPFTMMFAARAPSVPFAKRTFSVAVPAAGALTVNCA